MSTRSQLTKDLNESIKTVFGKQLKIILKNVVKLETKSDKTENRVLVFSPCRLFLLTAKIPTKIDTHFHYLEIQSIESKKLNQLCLSINDKTYSFLTNDDGSSQEVDAMIQAMYTALHNIFPTVPLTYIIRRVEVIPNHRIRYLEEWERYSGQMRGIGPCGGFSTQYACMCDLFLMPYRDEVAWDVDTIYLSHDTRELCLKDFDHLETKDLIPIVSALRFNTWFTKLNASHVKLSAEAIEKLLQTIQKSLSIEELYFDNLGLKWDFAHKLSMALISNANTVVHTLDLSSNLIEDKGASSLCAFIAKITRDASQIKSPIARIPKGLVRMNLSNCGLSSRGIGNVAHSLSLNKCMPETLSYLNLSGNSLKDDVTNLCNFLAQPNVITHLDISKTDCFLETIFGALLRGCAANLVHLNISHNAFNVKKNKELPFSYKQFFTSVLSLKYIDVSFCKLPVDALKNLLLGLAFNETIADVTLDISCNGLNSQGAHVLESCIHGVRCLSTLDISENNMEVDLAPVITAISKNKSLKHLRMGRNIIGMKAKYVAAVMESLVQIIQEEDCVLQTLEIPDSKLKSDLHSLINALGGNQSLVKLDISGNFMGDAGARLLGKALQINTHLRTISYDRNNITLQGYSDLAYALQSNYTMKYMPIPLYDITPCMKVAAERTDMLIKKIQDILHRNSSPKKYSNGHAFRLQQGFMSNSTQQMLTKLVSQTQETMKILGKEGEEEEGGDYDLTTVNELIKDAENSKHLLPYLHDVIQKREQGGNTVDVKLRGMAADLHTAIVNHLQETMEHILQSAESECPAVFDDEQFENELRSVARMKNFLEPEFAKSLIVDQIGAEITNKINDVNLAVASHVSDKITDQVIESLSKCHQALIGGSGRKRSSTPDVLKPTSRMSSGSSRIDDIFGNSADRSPIATPHLTSKKKSLHGRKLRPKSVVDNAEGSSVDDIPDLLPSLQSSVEESLDSVSELPKGRSQQLQHLAKGRPKRAKTRAATKAHPIRTGTDETDDSASIDTFFKSGSVTPLFSPASDDSISSIQMDASPNHSLNNSDCTIVCDNKNRIKHNSLPKNSRVELCHLESVSNSRSVSSDNLSKFSPKSPLARRIANFQQSPVSDGSGVISEKDEQGAANSLLLENSDDKEKENYNLKCDLEAEDEVELVHPLKNLKSPLLKPILSKEPGKFKLPVSLTPKPRRWSMVDNKPGCELNQVETENQEPVQECVVKPEKRSVRELAASLVKQSNELPENHRKPESGFNIMRPRNALSANPFILKQKDQQQQGDK